MKATKKYHQELIERLGRGEISEKIAMEKARFVDSLTNIQPFKVMYDLCEVMIKNSLANGKEDHFCFVRCGHEGESEPKDIPNTSSA